MLVEDTARTCAQYLSASRGEDTSEHRVNIFHILVLKGKICSAVQCITDREKGEVFQLGYICSKTG